MVDSALLTEMLQYSDVMFIEAAYSMILNRVPDEEGMKAHLLALLLGSSRKTVLFAVCRSEEGIKNAAVHSTELEAFFASEAGLGYGASEKETGRTKKRIKRFLARTFFRKEYDSLIDTKIELFRIRKENSRRIPSPVECPCTAPVPAPATAGTREELRELPGGVYDDFVKLCGGVF